MRKQGSTQDSETLAPGNGANPLGTPSNNQRRFLRHG